MALDYGMAIIISILLGVIFAIIVSIRYMLRIENKQEHLLNQVVKIEKTIKDAEDNIIKKLKR